MNVLAILALAYGAWVALALAMERHQQQAFGRALAPGQTLALRAGGWALLLMASVPAVQGWGWSVGLSLWVGALGLAAVGCGLVFSYRPRRAPRTGIALALLGAVCLFA